MSIPASCTHIMLSGAVCQSPAVKGTTLCYHHSAVKTALAQAPSRDSEPIPFVFAEDRAGLELNYFLLLQALNERRTDLRTGNLMLRILRAIDHNLAQSARSAESKPVQPAPKESAEAESNSEDPVAHARAFYERVMREREAEQQAEQQAAQPQSPIPSPNSAVKAPPQPDPSGAIRGQAPCHATTPNRAETPSGIAPRSEPAVRPSGQKISGMEGSMPLVQAVQFGGRS